MTRRASLLATLVVLGGCLLRTPESPRFFRPASAALDASDEDVTDAPAVNGRAVRLRAVRSEPFLRERIVWRVSDLEYGLYEQRRWIDLPAHYVERALSTRLRATPGLRLTEDPRAPALSVDVLAFDDVLAPTHEARVVLAVALDIAEHGHLLRRRFETRAAIADGDPSSMAKAMGVALDEAVAQVTDAVSRRVRTQRASRRP